MNYSVFVLVLFFTTCYSFLTGGVQDNTVKVASGEADAGTFSGYPDGINDTFSVDLATIAASNFAKSGDSGAFSGNRLFFGGGSSVSDSQLIWGDVSYDNRAVSKGDDTVAGSLFVFNDIENSDVNKYSIAAENTATTKNGAGDGTNAIAGSQTQIAGALTDGSSFGNQAVAVNNTATNKKKGDGNNDALAGVETAVGSVDSSLLLLQGTSKTNAATTKDGDATSGVENGINTVTDSSVYLTSDAYANDATSKNGNAVAGVQNSINTLEGTFPAGGVALVSTANSTKNGASATDGGSAVAGVVNNIGSAYRGFIDLDSTAYENTAYATGNSDDSGDAVAGTQTTISDIETSTVNLDSVSSGNVAFNERSSTNDESGNDAVAGNQVVIGNAVDANIIARSTSSDNTAVAVNGDAIAGNLIEVGQLDEDSSLNWNLYAENNQAVSVNGNAIINNDVTIGGVSQVYP